MIFSGDFVHPYSYSADRFKNLDAEFLQEKKILNFESTLEGLNGRILTKGIALYSKDDAIRSLKELNVKAVGLANNHIFDFDFKLDSFKEYFLSHHIKTIGVGKNLEEAGRPYVDHEDRIIVLNFGWDVIGCKFASLERKGVNPYKYKWVEYQLQKFRNAYNGFKIIVFVHWNYELERYPQPADRQFSFRMIDLGADAVIGHHNHLVSGYEYYKGKPIFYSLGNFYLPQTTYNGYKLQYPENSLIGLSVDLRNDGAIHYFLHQQSPEGDGMKILEKGNIEDCELLQKFSEFGGLSHQEYISFYEKRKFHRNKLLPTFKNYTSAWNRAKRRFVKLRQVPIDFYSQNIKT